MDNNVTGRTEGIVVDTAVPAVANAPITAADVVPLNYQTALASYSEAEQKEIIALSESIDVRKLDNVMSYGSVALKKAFDQCGELLKREKGSEADQKVIAQVVELAKKASDSYEDFNLELKEPNFVIGLFLKLFGKAKKGRSEKIQKRAVTTYKLLAELYASYDSWIKMLKEGMSDITDSSMGDFDSTVLLEKYIIAGKIAQTRIEQEIKDVYSKYEETGLQKYIQEHDELKEGYDIFCITMSNLEKSRITNGISMGQLAIIKRGNINAQVAINVQKQNTMTSISQQLRNAVMNEKTNEVLNGQKAISGLNNELLLAVSQNIGTTAEETERLMYAGFLNMEVAKKTVEIVLNSCKNMQEIAAKMVPEMEASTNEINTLLEQLRPVVESNPIKQETLKIENSPTSVTGG